MKQFFLIIVVVLFTFSLSAQKKATPDTVTIKIPDLDFVYVLRVNQYDQKLSFVRDDILPSDDYMNISLRSTGEICDIHFRSWARIKSNGKVLLHLVMVPVDGKIDYLFDKQIRLKKGEKKEVIIKTMLQCMNYKQYSVVLNY